MKKIGYLICLASTVSFAGSMGDVSPMMISDGFYLGAGVGAMSLDYKTKVFGITPQAEHFGDSGALGTIFLGYNQYVNSWFNVGLEAFYSFYGLDNTLTAGNPSASSTYKADYNYGLKLLPAVNIMNHARLFADVGIAAGHFNYNPSSLARSFGAPSSYPNTLASGILGLGTDVALTNHLSCRVEYQNISYMAWDISTRLITGTRVQTQFENNANQFIASLIYHFG